MASKRYEVTSDMLTFAKDGATITETDIPEHTNIDVLLGGGHLKEITTAQGKAAPQTESESS